MFNACTETSINGLLKIAYVFFFFRNKPQTF